MPLPAPADTPRKLHKPHDLLQRLGVAVCKARGYKAVPSQIVLHVPQEIMAKAIPSSHKDKETNRETVWRWLAEMKERGLIDFRPHYTTTTVKGEQVSRPDGTLIAVPLRADVRPRLRFDDLKHKYRDLDADRKAGRTAYGILQQSKDLKEKQDWYSILVNWCVTPGSVPTQAPLDISDCCNSMKSLSDVAYALPLVAEADWSKRVALVELLGDALARVLCDPSSRKMYYSLIWQAWRNGGKQGLEALGTRLTALAVTLREQPIRNPGALLTWRERHT